ncbi:MAG TPA: hypothetical protein PL045_11665, partial [Chitinophagaceae bacterium]|nr:hypothetical protein [Chitinophagaceae bacterium]
MKRKLFCSAIAIVIVLFLMPYFTWAQRITQLAPNTIKVEQPYYPCSASVSPCFIMHTVPPGPVYSSSSASPGTRTIWLEYGDGGFTTDPTKARDIYGTPGNPLLLVNKLYDTSRDNFRIYSQLQLSQNTNTQRTSDNDFVMLSGNPGNSIKITP